MTISQLVLSLVSSLEWPITLVVVLVIFKPAISAQLSSLSHIKSKYFEAEFINAGNNTALSISQELVDSPRLISPPVTASNISQVSTTWLALVSAVSAKLPESEAKPSTDEGKLKVALDKGVISQPQYQSLRGLLAMKNLAETAPSVDITDNQLREFMVLADTISLILSIPNPRVGAMTAAAIQGQSVFATATPAQAFDILEGERKLRDDKQP